MITIKDEFDNEAENGFSWQFTCFAQLSWYASRFACFSWHLACAPELNDYLPSFRDIFVPFQLSCCLLFATHCFLPLNIWLQFVITAILYVLWLQQSKLQLSYSFYLVIIFKLIYSIKYVIHITLQEKVIL